MTQKIPVKLCSYSRYKTLIDQHCEDGLPRASISFEEDLINFLKELPTHEVSGTTSIKSFAMDVWQETEFMTHSHTSMTFKKPDDERIERSLFCFQYDKNALPVATKLEELYHDSCQVLVLVYQQRVRHVIHRDTELIDAAYWERRWKNKQKVTTFSDFVCESLSNASSNFKAVLIDKVESEQVLNRPFRGLYTQYVKAAKKYTEGLLEVSFLEKSNEGLNKEHLDYWESKLRQDRLLASQFIGDTSSMPYSRKELKQIIPRSISLGKLPFWLLYRNLDEGHIIVTMPEGKGSAVFLDVLIRTFLSVQGKIRSETYELKKTIEARLQENVVASPAPPSPSSYQSKPGSRARYQEAMARAQQQKEHGVSSPKITNKTTLPKGKIRQEDLPAQIDFLFQFEGARILSFDHFKQKFLEYYPRLLDRRGPRLV
ncbi:MAG: hypothetical protein R8G66_02390 [Cytophagales bacterium]|nr:hypothetical protein [Cytophagales bacterium]